MSDATITALHVYPVKGCRALAPTRACVTSRGLLAEAFGARLGDREWMLVDAGGSFVSQRSHPRLALIEPSLADGALVLAAPGAPPLAVALAPRTGPMRAVRVWESRVAARDEGDEAARWLSGFAGDELRLVRFDPATRRDCPPRYAQDTGAHVAFADAYPLLVTGEASLADLNARLAARGAAALPMNRFRPNVVLAGIEPYDEDHLDTIAACGVTLRLVKPCTRCKVTTTDQETAEVGTEPLPTLAGYRHDPDLGGVTFGMNAVVLGGEGRELHVGARAECNFAF